MAASLSHRLGAPTRFNQPHEFALPHCRIGPIECSSLRRPRVSGDTPSTLLEWIECGLIALCVFGGSPKWTPLDRGDIMSPRLNSIIEPSGETRSLLMSSTLPDQSAREGITWRNDRATNNKHLQELSGRSL